MYSKYAEILASQGCLETAMGYLMTVNDQVNCKTIQGEVFLIRSLVYLQTVIKISFQKVRSENKRTFYQIAK